MRFQIRGLSIAYGPIAALNGLNLDLAAGETVALIGSNGAGKSSTLKAIMGLAPRTAGEILLEENRIENLPTRERIRAGVALSPEGRQVFPDLTVVENLELGYFARNSLSFDARRDSMFELFPLLRERSGQAAGSLSGGEQQMLAIARALMSSPHVLLLDEPSLGLAPIVVRQLAELLPNLNRAGVSVLLSEQNASLALQVSHRGYVLANGVMELSGPTQLLQNDPAVRRAYLGA